jgi:hypothetical protein
MKGQLSLFNGIAAPLILYAKINTKRREDYAQVYKKARLFVLIR